MLNLDTHILLHALNGNLSAREKNALANDSWSISGIVLWEITKLAQLKRIEIDLEDPAVIRALSRIHVWPITLEVCQAMTELDFHSDPADELIAATSLAHNIPLATRDQVIRKTKKVPLAW